jgi:hypothetical protein
MIIYTADLHLEFQINSFYYSSSLKMSALTSDEPPQPSLPHGTIVGVASTGVIVRNKSNNFLFDD